MSSLRRAGTGSVPAQTAQIGANGCCSSQIGRYRCACVRICREPFAYNFSSTGMDGRAHLSRCYAAAFLAALLIASSSSSARSIAVPGCDAAVQLPDQSWLIRNTSYIGSAGKVDAGSIVWRGTVINGLDIGEFLDRRCFRRYAIEPDYPPFLWAPNGSPSWATPIR